MPKFFLDPAKVGKNEIEYVKTLLMPRLHKLTNATEQAKSFNSATKPHTVRAYDCLAVCEMEVKDGLQLPEVTAEETAAKGQESNFSLG